MKPNNYQIILIGGGAGYIGFHANKIINMRGRFSVSNRSTQVSMILSKRLGAGSRFRKRINKCYELRPTIQEEAIKAFQNA